MQAPASDSPSGAEGDRSLSPPRPLPASPRNDVDRVVEGGLGRLPSGGLEPAGEGEDRRVLGNPLLEPRDQGAEYLGPGGAAHGRDLVDLPFERLEGAGGGPVRGSAGQDDRPPLRSVQPTIPAERTGPAIAAHRSPAVSTPARRGGTGGPLATAVISPAPARAGRCRFSSLRILLNHGLRSQAGVPGCGRTSPASSSCTFYPPTFSLSINS